MFHTQQIFHSITRREVFREILQSRREDGLINILVARYLIYRV